MCCEPRPLTPMIATLYLSLTGYADRILKELAAVTAPNPKLPVANVLMNDLRLMSFFILRFFIE